MKISFDATLVEHYGFDLDQSLLCGLTVELKKTKDGNNKVNTRSDKRLKLLFSGDTDWFDKAHEIGRRYRPFNVAAIPIGMDEPRWFMKQQHMNMMRFVSWMHSKRERRFPL